MPIIIIEVMPKAELLDPQGKAVSGALHRLGKNHISGVRIGKRFEVTVDGPVTDAVLAEVRTLADELFSNSVIEDVLYVGEPHLYVGEPHVGEPQALEADAR